MIPTAYDVMLIVDKSMKGGESEYENLDVVDLFFKALVESETVLEVDV